MKDLVGGPKSYITMFFRKIWVLFFLSLVMFSGCARDDQDYRQLSQQQSATLLSLQKEVSRLNQELEDTVGSRDILESVELQLKEVLTEEISRGDITVALEKRGLGVTILDRGLFDPEERQLTSSAKVSLDKIADVIAKDFSGKCIFVEGHTDDQPVSGPEKITNWEYSVGRADAVLHYFVDVKGLPPAQFRITGCGEYQPVASNETEKGRDQNRRVVILISAEKTAAH